MSDEFEGLDLDQERQVRAATREGKKAELPIRIGGEVIATLPAELPFGVITPLRKIDDTIALVIREGMRLVSDQAAAAKWQSTELVVNILASNENLPTKVVEVIEEISTNLLTREGMDRFMAANPSMQDIKALALGIFAYYGVSLGEASPSSDSSTGDGGTSPTTSSTNSDSTPEESGPNQEPLAS
jgi:hypothetical protein